MKGRKPRAGSVPTPPPTSRAMCGRSAASAISQLFSASSRIARDEQRSCSTTPTSRGGAVSRDRRRKLGSRSAKPALSLSACRLFERFYASNRLKCRICTSTILGWFAGCLVSVLRSNSVRIRFAALFSRLGWSLRLPSIGQIKANPMASRSTATGTARKPISLSRTRSVKRSSRQSPQGQRPPACSTVQNASEGTLPNRPADAQRSLSTAATDPGARELTV